MSFLFVCWQIYIRNTNQLSWAINYTYSLFLIFWLGQVVCHFLLCQHTKKDMAGFRSWLTNSTYLHLSTYNKRQSRVIRLPEQASNQERPYLSLLLKPKSLHFNCACCAIGGMVRVPLLPRVSCSFALGRRHQVPGISCQVPQVPAIRYLRYQVSGVRYTSWLTFASVDCFSHILFEFWKTQVFGFLSVFNIFCTIWWWISFTGPRISMASARSLVETYFDKNGSSLKKCQAYSGVPNLLTESQLLFFPHIYILTPGLRSYSDFDAEDCFGDKMPNIGAQ